MSLLSVYVFGRGALALDGVDGQVARRTGTASELGARFDMEVDAFLILVLSVAAGRVVYADWLKGYGMLMVIDHGRGNMSLYANNDALLKDVGESVAPGERIATVGTSGAQNRAALYFEMRLNGQPQNPNAWLRP